MGCLFLIQVAPRPLAYCKLESKACTRGGLVVAEGQAGDAQELRRATPLSPLCINGGLKGRSFGRTLRVREAPNSPRRNCFGAGCISG